MPAWSGIDVDALVAGLALGLYFVLSVAVFVVAISIFRRLVSA